MESPAPRKGAAVAGSASTDMKTIYDWFLGHGFTVAPSQAAWLSELLDADWAVVGLIITPPLGRSASETFTGPVIGIGHAAESLVYPGSAPSAEFRLKDAQHEVPLELAILTETGVSVDVARQVNHFVFEHLSAERLRRIAKKARGIPWTFLRDGALTAYRLERPQNIGLISFRATDNLKTTRPRPEKRTSPIHIPVPVEGVLLGGVVVIWLWRGRRRRISRVRRQKLR